MAPLKRRNQEGQAITEYILLLAVVTSVAAIILGSFKKLGLADTLASPIKNNFARSYQYGHPEALGYEDGGPKFHPRAVEGGTNFRIFYLSRP